jgi:tRNA(fMet)-specific endonuclease VapC
VGWLIDTNGWISYLKGRSPVLAERLLNTPCDEVFVCAPVVAELLHGALKYGNPNVRRSRVREALAPHQCLPFDEAAAGHYAEIRHDLV